MDSIDIMKAFLLLGKLDDKTTREEKLAYETKIVFATMQSKIPDWMPPDDWDQLPIEEREKRINNIKKFI